MVRKNAAISKLNYIYSWTPSSRSYIDLALASRDKHLEFKDIKRFVLMHDDIMRRKFLTSEPSEGKKYFKKQYTGNLL